MGEFPKLSINDVPILNDCLSVKFT